MTDYTNAEIQTSVEKIVRSTIRKPYGVLGNRDTQTTFNDLQDAASGVYILKPNAPFYTVFLGTKRLTQRVSEEQNIISALIEAIENTNRRVAEIDNLAPLNNARAALDALSGAAGSRNSVFQTIESVPAYQRYDVNVQRFLDESSKHSRKNGRIVSTPQESRSKLAGLVRDLISQHASLVSKAGSLGGAIDDFDSLSLPSLVAQGVITNARAVLESRISELAGLSPINRLNIIREVTLDLLTGRAAVAGLGSLRATTTFAQVEGVGVVYADIDHPAIAAQLPAEILGPYPIYTGQASIDIRVDDSFTFQAPLPGSFVAQISSAMTEPYAVVVGQNDELTIQTRNPGLTQTTTVILTPGSTQSANDVASDINTALPANSFVLAESVFQTFRFIGVVDLDQTGSLSDMDLVLPSPGTWSALGTREGDYVRVTDVLSANFGSEYQVDTGGIAGGTLTCTQLSGPAPTDEVLQRIEVGFGRTVRLRIKDADVAASLSNRTTITFPLGEPQSALEGNLSLVTPVPMALGFGIGAQIRSRATLATQISQDLPQVATTQTGGVARLDVDTEFVGTLWDGPGRSDPDNPSILHAYRLWVRADVPAGQLNLVIPLLVDPAAGGVVPGDIVRIRETPVAADLAALGTVITVTPTSIVVTFSVPQAGGTDLQLEVQPQISNSSEYLEARVTGSPSQDGEYFMDAGGQVGSIPDFVMEGQVSAHRGPGGQPVFFNLELGFNRVIFKSTTTDLSTKVEVFDGGGASAASRFFSSLPSNAVGTTPYFQLPHDPRSIQLGDTLEFTESIYNVVSQSFYIVGLELSQLLLEVEPGMATDFGSVAMTQGAPPPFGRVRLGKKNNYVVFEEALSTWLNLPQNDAAYFVELQRLLNPLIVNSNPTAAQVNTAKLHVQQLLATLTRQGAIVSGADPSESLEAILMSYVVSPVEEVDVLVDTYLERGATRGVDLLLEGRFSSFFGLTPEAMSYDGAARVALQLVQRLDMPVRKINRLQDLAQSQTVAEWEDPDFDFDQSDVDDPEDIEIPADFAEVSSLGR
jgi:hypothetical protein